MKPLIPDFTFPSGNICMNNEENKKSFIIRIAVQERTNIILQFQKEYLTEYLWPRNFNEFRKLAEEECLYEVVELLNDNKEELIGICYIMYGSEPNQLNAERIEFGGLYVRQASGKCGG